MRNQTAVADRDRLDTISTCWTAVSDLMIPESDLHVVDRAKLATLLGFLASEYQDARKRITQPLSAQ